MPARGHIVAPLLLLAGCASPVAGRTVEQLPVPVPETARVEVWTGDHRDYLYAVTVDADSLRGIRWGAPRACDSCRVTLARSAITSVGLSPDDSDQLKLFGGAIVAIVAFLLVFPKVQH